MYALMNALGSRRGSARAVENRQYFRDSAKEQPIEVEGTVTQVLPRTFFRVTLANGHVVLAYLAGNVRTHFIRISVGDKVRMEMSPYDLTKGRITYRF